MLRSRQESDQVEEMTKRVALPDDFESLRTMILEQRELLPKRIAQIAACSLDNPDEIAFGTAASIATSAGVQPLTLIRFAQHLGFDGFSSLQAVLRKRLRERNSSYDERLSALHKRAGNGVGHRAIFEGFVTAASTSLDRVQQVVGEKDLDAAIGLLAKAETIFIIARRRSYPVASYIAYAFGKLGIRYQLVESVADLNPEVLAFATSKDAALAVSFSPYTPSTIQDARRLSEQAFPWLLLQTARFRRLLSSPRSGSKSWRLTLQAFAP